MPLMSRIDDHRVAFLIGLTITFFFVGAVRVAIAETNRILWTDSRVIGFPDPPPPFEAQRVFPNLKFPKPLKVTALPGTSDLLVHVHHGEYGGPGRLLRFTPGAQESEWSEFLVLDDIIYGIAFHPDFQHNGLVYVGCNGRSEALDKICTRVLRFHVSRDAPFECDPESKTKIIEWPSNGHNGGDLVFDDDGLLFVSAGDGTSDSDANHAGQDLSVLPGSMLRINVDHPSENLPYSIPNDNPFLDIEGARPEIWAYGLRNPWRIALDEETGDLWAGINGQDLWETVQVVRRGENYGWSITEGSQPFQPNRKRGPTPIVMPTIEHPHSEARSLTGGCVYYGQEHPSLYGHYVYGDYSTGMIWAAKYDSNSQKVVSHFLVARTSLQITGFGVNHDNELLIVDHAGGLYRLVPTTQQQSSDFPRRLSQTGVYKSTVEKQIHPGLIPYEVNSPLWSDGATKQRYIGLPGNETAEFQTSKSWNFPDGTVLVKNFALPVKNQGDQDLALIETRLLARQNGEWYGYSYAWNPEQTDAYLVESEGRDQVFELESRDSVHEPSQQTWRFPSRAECMVCHSRAQDFVLGLSVRQNNRSVIVDGKSKHQLEHFAKLGIFHHPPTESADGSANDTDDKPFAFRRSLSDLPKLPDPSDPTLPIESRVRSYLHSNCANCHVKEGGGNSKFTLGFDQPLEKTRMIDVAGEHDSFGLKDAKLISPGEPDSSLLLHRMGRRGRGQMPPLATSVVDRNAVTMIRQWIAEMKVDSPQD